MVVVDICEPRESVICSWFFPYDNSLLTGAHIVQRAHKKGLGEMGGQEAGNGPKFSFHFISFLEAFA